MDEKVILFYYKKTKERTMTLLHSHGTGGVVWEFFCEVILHGLTDTLKLLPFLFLTYILMEFIEHRANGKVMSFMHKAGGFGPLIGGVLGAAPQCGFSAAASNLYTGGVVTLGTLIAVFLSTSDEMIPILIGGSIPPATVAVIVLYKTAVGVLCGFSVDLVLRLMHRDGREINIDELCENDECHCEKGILYSAVHHTVTISLFVFLATVLINAAVFFVGEETLSSLFSFSPFLGYLFAALIGLIPNCASSVILSTLCTEGIISAGTMMSGLFTGAGVGLLVLFRVNKRVKENVLIVLILLAFACVFGPLGDLIVKI